jgi:hypothetical protein
MSSTVLVSYPATLEKEGPGGGKGSTSQACASSAGNWLSDLPTSRQKLLLGVVFDTPKRDLGKSLNSKLMTEPAHTFVMITGDKQKTL